MISFVTLFLVLQLKQISAFNVQQQTQKHHSNAFSNRRAFLATTTTTIATSTTLLLPKISNAASTASPTIYTTTNGVKYAITNKASKQNKPQKGDFVAIEYTGYLTNGKIFDATHSKGKSNALLFQLGSTAAIPGINEVVLQGMNVGDSVQAIIPPALAYGEKGICLENGECLIEPNSTLVYDIYLKKSSIPPP